jgi:hypothetical protein
MGLASHHYGGGWNARSQRDLYAHLHNFFVPKWDARMHNHITSDRCAWPSVSKQPGYASASSNNASRMKAAFDSLKEQGPRDRSNPLGKTVPPTIEFEGFGSFSG